MASLITKMAEEAQSVSDAPLADKKLSDAGGMYDKESFEHEAVHKELGTPQSDDCCSVATQEITVNLPAGSDGDKNDLPAADQNDLEACQRVVTTSSGPLYSVFSQRKKRYIVFMAAVAGFFSPLSANIYFPALNILAKEYNVSSSLINLTLTGYMIFQGLAPTLMGDLADFAGRRPAYMICFTVYIAACIGIALQHSFAGLFVLRCMQSTGSSGTIALGIGTVADISTPDERGVYMGWVSTGALLGPAVGPILGGVLSQFLGWRAIFWFLVIFAGVFLIPLLVTFPETGRNVVGNGSIPPQGWNMSLLNYLAVRRSRAESRRDAVTQPTTAKSQEQLREKLAEKRKFKFPNPLHSLRVVFEKDIGLLLLYNSLVFTAFYEVLASLPYLFERIYGFNVLQVGLCFIPFGFGCLLAAIVNGRLMDWNFRRIAKQTGIVVDRKRGTSLRNFPLEKARGQVAVPLVLIGDACLLAYGWVVQAETNLAVPLVILFIMGYSLNGSFNSMSVMLVDNYPKSPATATAANNLMRCSLGAAGTAIIIEMIEGMGRGWCFTFIAAIVFLASPILYVLMRWGPKWREERRVRDEGK